MKYILIVAIILSSCSTVKRYSYESVNLQQGEISKYHVQAKLVYIKPTPRGYKHTFVTDKKDTLIRYHAKPMIKDSCYYVWKTKLEKHL